ncbi:MAG: serine hydrolase [Solidesulfovibrio sp.]|uniref:serine hydrolase domain-containing protein n=1 Tax=Solidesulfovibrio sp. TaxID=2910990 RepID=UPI003159711E
MRHVIRRSLAALVLVSVSVLAASARADTAFPAGAWDIVDPGSLGWDAARLDSARRFAEAIGSSAVMIVWDGKVLAEWGDTREPFPIHSMRKSLMSALLGIAVAKGRLELDTTLGQLGIDDSTPSLTEDEKQARIRDLIMARSGVYHEAAYETRTMRERRPARGSHPPGTFWYYNNWDFNVLATILQDATGIDFYEALQRWIAEPVGMQDYTLRDGDWIYAPSSIYPAYTLRMSARDLARFGLLYLNRGQWQGRQVVPARWVGQSIQPYSPVSPGLGYGYLWWVASGDRQFDVRLGPGSYSARGHGGQVLVVIPSRRLVIVHLCQAESGRASVSKKHFHMLLAKILEARPDQATVAASPKSMPLD